MPTIANIYYNNLRDAVVAWDSLAKVLDDISFEETYSPSETKNQYQIEEQFDGKTVRYAIVQKKVWAGFNEENFGFLGRKKILSISEINKKLIGYHLADDHLAIHAADHLNAVFKGEGLDLPRCKVTAEEKTEPYIKISSLGGFANGAWQLPIPELSTENPANKWNEVFSLSELPIENVKKHVPQSEIEVHSLVSAISKLDLIPWHSSKLLCYARVELCIAFLKLMGIPEENIKKQYISVPSQYRKSPYSWTYHVAVMIVAADGTKWILDPLFSPTRGLTLKEWMSFQTKGKFQLAGKENLWIKSDKVITFTTDSNETAFNGLPITMTFSFKNLLPYIYLKLALRANGIRQQI